MKDIKYFENIIKEKRKNTDFRIFLKEIVSWSSLNYYKNKSLISIFPESNRIQNINNIEEFNKKRDKLFSLEYNNNFFKDFSSLLKNVQLPSTRQYGTYINSNYGDTNLNMKNSIFTRCSTTSKNIGYSLVVKNTENVFNSIKIQGGEGNIYNSYSIDNGFNIFYSKCLENSSNIWFSYNLKNCHECIFCDSLENISYSIDNKVLDKDIYLKKKKEILSNKLTFHKYSQKVTGNNLNNNNCENIESVYGGTNIKNGKNSIIVGNPVGVENVYDTIFTGTLGNYYGTVDSGGNSENIFCSITIVSSNSIYYSFFLENCSYCIGCIGIKNKSYCILNNQYTKEEWEKLAIQIFEQMEQDGTLGDFFPGKLNPFYFNDTVAGLIGGFKKEEVEKEGYMWRDEEIKVDIPEGVEIINTTDLGKYEGFDSEGNWKINSEILKVVIIDKKGNYYRIVKMEYDFLMKHKLPLPRIHWLDRIKLGFGI